MLWSKNVPFDAIFAMVCAILIKNQEKIPEIIKNYTRSTRNIKIYNILASDTAVE